MFKLGYTPIRALSVGGAYGDLRDDWDALTDRERKWIDFLPWLIVMPAIVLLVATIWLGGTAVHASLRTEHLIYTPLFSDPPVWLLKDARFESTDFNAIDPFAETPEPAANNGAVHTITEGKRKTTLVNGFLQLSCGDRVTISRIGDGAIKVNVNGVRDANITDDTDKPVAFVRPLGRSYSFYPQVVGSIASSSYVWALEGQIIPSRVVGIDTLDTQGLMLEGRVDLHNRRILGGGSYLVDSHELELGDHLILATAKSTEEKRENILQAWAQKDDKETTDNTNASSPWTPDQCKALQPDEESFRSLIMKNSANDKGFLHIDEEKGIAVSIASNAKNVEIGRYRSAGVLLKSGVIKRLQNDQFFSLSWSAILFSFFAYRKLARAYVMSRGRQERQEQQERSVVSGRENDVGSDSSAQRDAGAMSAGTTASREPPSTSSD